MLGDATGRITTIRDVDVALDLDSTTHHSRVPIEVLSWPKKVDLGPVLHRVDFPPVVIEDLALDDAPTIAPQRPNRAQRRAAARRRR